MHKELSPKQKITESIRSSLNTVVVLNPDSLSDLYAGYAFALYLTGLGGVVSLYAQDEHRDAVLRGIFPDHEESLSGEYTGQSYKIRVAPKEAVLKSVRYHPSEGGGVDIEVQVDSGVPRPEDVLVSVPRIEPDLYLCFGMGAYRRLEGRQIAASVAVLSAREKCATPDEVVCFGSDSASSLGEMLVALCEAIDKDRLDAQVATGFYASILVATDRFQNEATTPKALTVSAQLLAAGARRGDILKKLFSYTPSPEEKKLRQIDAGDHASESHAAEVSEDLLYAPQASDIESESPVVLESPDSNVLKRLMQEKKSSSAIDFSALEQDIQKKSGGLRDGFDERE